MEDGCLTQPGLGQSAHNGDLCLSSEQQVRPALGKSQPDPAQAPPRSHVEFKATEQWAFPPLQQGAG
jgi:hypothetical protein